MFQRYVQNGQKFSVGWWFLGHKEKVLWLTFLTRPTVKIWQFLRLTSKCFFWIFKECCPVSRDPHNISKFHEVEKKIEFKYAQEWERPTECQNCLFHAIPNCLLRVRIVWRFTLIRMTFAYWVVFTKFLFSYVIMRSCGHVILTLFHDFFPPVWQPSFGNHSYNHHAGNDTRPLFWIALYWPLKHSNVVTFTWHWRNLFYPTFSWSLMDWRHISTPQFDCLHTSNLCLLNVNSLLFLSLCLDLFWSWQSRSDFWKLINNHG